MSQACPFATRPTHAIILFNVLNEHPIQALQPARKPNNHIFPPIPLLKLQMMSARPQNGMAEKYPERDSRKELVYKKRDGV